MRLKDLTRAIRKRNDWILSLTNSCDVIMESLEMVAKGWAKEGHPEPEHGLGKVFLRQIADYRWQRENDPEHEIGAP